MNRIKIEILKYLSSAFGWKMSYFIPYFEGIGQFPKSVIGYIDQPAAGLLVAMVFGTTDQLPSDMRLKFKTIGMQHALSASGFNVGVMVSLVSPLISRFWRYYRLLIWEATIWGYVWLAGGSPSLLRAAVMSSLSVVTQTLFWRPLPPERGLFWSSVGLLCWQPDLVTNASFQLSVLATLSIIWFAPWCEQIFNTPAGRMVRWEQAQLFSPQAPQQAATSHTGPSGWVYLLGGSQLKAFFMDSFQVTLAAQILTLPLVLYRFQEMSLLTLVSNTLLLGFTPWLTVAAVIHMLGVLLTSWCGPLQLVIGTTTGLVLSLAATAFWWAVSFLGQWPAVVVKVPGFTAGMMLAWWSGVVSWRWLWHHRQSRSISRRQSIGLFPV